MSRAGVRGKPKGPVPARGEPGPFFNRGVLLYARGFPFVPAAPGTRFAGLIAFASCS
jgi:hypothetical protein